MMAIPQLTSCCFGCCSLKTGTKVIGWLSLIAAILMLVISSMSLAGIYYIEDHPEEQPPEAKVIIDHLAALKPLTIFLICVHVIGCALAFILLLGAYQNKAKMVFIWVVITLASCLVEQSLNLVEMVALGQPNKIFNFLFFLVDLYFILVVYSFYREIKNMADYA